MIISFQCSVLFGVQPNPVFRPLIFQSYIPIHAFRVQLFDVPLLGVQSIGVKLSFLRCSVSESCYVLFEM